MDQWLIILNASGCRSSVWLQVDVFRSSPTVINHSPGLNSRLFPWTRSEAPLIVGKQRRHQRHLILSRRFDKDIHTLLPAVSAFQLSAARTEHTHTHSHTHIFTLYTCWVTHQTKIKTHPEEGHLSYCYVKLEWLDFGSNSYDWVLSAWWIF